LLALRCGQVSFEYRYADKVRLSSFTAIILTCTLIPAAQAGRILTGSLAIPGILPDTLNPPQQTVVGLMVIQARNALSGIDARTTKPWPCVVDDTVAGFITPNTLESYARIKASLAKQGWKLLKEVKTPNENQYSMMFTKNGVNIMGMWAKAYAGARSTVFLCQQTKNWQPAAPSPPPQTAPLLTLPFNVVISGWKLTARSVRVVAPNVNGASLLLATGAVTRAGNLTLRLPEKPDPALLRPASDWLHMFGLSESDCISGNPQGKFKLSDANAKLLILGDIDVLNGALSITASAKQFLSAPSEHNHMIWSGNFSSGISKILLVYSSGPVSIQGKQTCADGSGSLMVNVTLPGGWTALKDELRIPDTSDFKTHTLLNASPNQVREGWHDTEF
jgi:hypothetical protein